MGLSEQVACPRGNEVLGGKGKLQCVFSEFQNPISQLYLSAPEIRSTNHIMQNPKVQAERKPGPLIWSTKSLAEFLKSFLHGQEYINFGL